MVIASFQFPPLFFSLASDNSQNSDWPNLLCLLRIHARNTRLSFNAITISSRSFPRRWDIRSLERKKPTNRASTRENTAVRKYPHTSPLPFEEYPRRACEHAGDEEIYLRIPSLPPPPLLLHRPIPSSGNERTGSPPSKRPRDTRVFGSVSEACGTRGAVCFFFISLGEI